MKILHVIASLDPADGGPPGIASRLAAAQASLGHDVTLLAYVDAERRAQVDTALGIIPHIDRCRLELVPQDGWRDRLLASSVAARADELLDGVAVAHLHGIWDPVLMAVARGARRLGRPYVILANGMLEPWSLEQRKWKKKLALKLGYRDMLDRALFLHTGNADEGRLIAPLRLRCPVEVFPNGVFLEEVDPLPPPGSFRREHPELGDRPYVLFLGRLHSKKGLDYLADAFARIAQAHPDVALVVAGPDGGAASDFETRISAKGLSARVIMTGPLLGIDKMAALVDAACFCLPSRAEGFSLAVTEALACGVPVVISEACHFPEVAAAGAGEVVKLDAAAVAAGLSRILADAGLRQRMGKAGRELVLSRYTWPSIAREVVTAYERAGVQG